MQRRQSELADASAQLRILNQPVSGPAFDGCLAQHDLAPLTADRVKILQVNVGKMCNMTCRHCHVDAGPDRREIMTRETIDQCLAAIESAQIETLDLTGGAPEMNPHFRDFVSAARDLGVHVIDRCNLTILLANGYQDLPEFLADHQVEVVASLPCYLQENTDQQRGDGAYAMSVEALQKLNQHGYATGDDSRQLTLVYNPVGPNLPPAQSRLEDDYRAFLRAQHGIEFSRLFTITNMPISRFLEDLLEQGQYEAYMQTLVDAFNPAAVQGLMCRQMISVGWDGRLYDCDFNQMLELGLGAGLPQQIADFAAERLDGRHIVSGPHCFGCTAGAGSSCSGAIDA
ncbi:MAG: arsenosugar biosynthesis radical SAM (seleno)protein ArsS [Planctomycetota bacterium]